MLKLVEVTRPELQAGRTQASASGSMPAEIARGYKALLEIERCWRDLKQLEFRPVYHRKQERCHRPRAAVLAR